MELPKQIIMLTITVVVVLSDFSDCSSDLDRVARYRLSSMFAATFVADSIIVVARSQSTTMLVAFVQRQAIAELE